MKNTTRSLNWLVALFLLAAFAALSLSLFKKDARVIVLTTQDRAVINEALRKDPSPILDLFTNP